MGMYTELVCAFEIPENVSPHIIHALEIMVGKCGEDDQPLPNHELFQTARWTFMLRCDSYYFDGDTDSTIRYDDIGKCYFVTIRCNLKNYDNEIEKFIDWIKLFTTSTGYIGYSRYEEAKHPTLIYI